MLRNYLKTALRVLRAQFGYALFNLLGLAVGMAACLLIVLFVRHELSYDRYHTQSDRIYRLVEVIEGAEESSSVPFPTGPTLQETFPHLVEHAVRFFNFQAPTLTLSYEPPGGSLRRFNEPRLFFADSTVFEVFDFPLQRGDPRHVLAEPNTIIVTRAMAQKYFGDADPIGKVLQFEGRHDLRVTGVLGDIPDASHFQLDALISFESLKPINGEIPDTWYWNPCWTYVLLREGVGPETLEDQFPDFVTAHFHPAIVDKTSMYLQPLTDIHLHSHLDFEIEANSSMAYVYIFSVIAGFILLIACINFMNLATARSARRAQEVGVRKAVGARRGQLVRQFLGESVGLSLLALLLAVPLARSLLPVMNRMAHTSLTLDLTDGWLMGGLVLVAIGVGLGAGVYPALLLSAFDPTQVLKDSLPLGMQGRSALLRRVLVVVQFALSIVLIVGAIVAFQQLRFLQNARLGFDQEQVVMVPMLRSELPMRYGAAKDELLTHPGVRAVTIAEDVLGSKYQTGTYRPEGMNDPQQYLRMFVHDDFVEVMGIELVAGRSFSKRRDYGGDPAKSVVLINEAMVEHLGWETPEQAVGKMLARGTEVVGVTRNFHYASLRQRVGPFVLHRLHDQPDMLSFFGRYLAVRIGPDDVPRTLAHIEATWKAFAPHQSFDYFFMDEDLDRLYRAEATLGQLAAAFAILAIAIACLGLFGLVAYTVTQRTKEIGIRKVLGASAPSILALLAKDFVRLVGVAFVLAVPVAYLCVDQWLGGFAYRVVLRPWVFVVAGMLVLLIALLTVSVQSLKTAFASPAQSLHHE